MDAIVNRVFIIYLETPTWPHFNLSGNICNITRFFYKKLIEHTSNLLSWPIFVANVAFFGFALSFEERP